jgi:hypothetical protein
VDVIDKPSVVDSDEVSSVSMTVEEMRKELFESDDVIMDKFGDHGLSALTEMKKDAAAEKAGE